MTIRTANTGEEGVLSEIAFTAKASLGYSTDFMEACREELTYSAAQLQAPSFHFFVAEIGERPVGFIAIESIENGQCAIDGLFVLPKFSSQGIGKKLMRRAMEWASDQDCVGINIQSDPGATEFYTSFGAFQVGESPSGSIPGRVLPQLFIDLTDYDVS